MGPVSRYFGALGVLVPVFGLGLCVSSCISGFETIAADVPPTGWHEAATLRYANTDTLTLRELTLTLRHSADASPHEGFYVVSASSPSGAGTRDTVRITLNTFAATDNNLHETHSPLRKNVRLAETGDYLFTVTPIYNTLGVWSVALDFKKL